MKPPAHVGVAGWRGRMGRAVSQALEQRDDAFASVRFDRGDAPDLKSCDVVIDFSVPQASVELAERCAREGGPPIVVGTTGFSAQDLDRLEAAARKVALVISGNFSLGLNILVGLVEQAAHRLGPEAFDVEVLEAHHRRKVDAPSGTALMLGEAAARGRGRPLSDLRAPVRDGLSGPRGAGEIGFAALRGGGLVGEHTVIFAGEDEIISLSHSARDRALFARGAVEAALWVIGRAPGVYDMQDVLGFRPLRSA